MPLRALHAQGGGPYRNNKTEHAGLVMSGKFLIRSGVDLSRQPDRFHRASNLAPTDRKGRPMSLLQLIKNGAQLPGGGQRLHRRHGRRTALQLGEDRLCRIGSAAADFAVRVPQPVSVGVMPANCEWPCGQVTGQVPKVAPVVAWRRMPKKQAVMMPPMTCRRPTSC